MNQVKALRDSGVDARTLNSNTPQDEKEHIYLDLASGHPRTRLLYVTPELCSGDFFRQRLQLVHEQKELARIVVDEAHCISECTYRTLADNPHTLELTTDVPFSL